MNLPLISHHAQKKKKWSKEKTKIRAELKETETQKP